jgi:hypothetical protein
MDMTNFIKESPQLKPNKYTSNNNTISNSSSNSSNSSNTSTSSNLSSNPHNNNNNNNNSNFSLMTNSSLNGLNLKTTNNQHHNQHHPYATSNGSNHHNHHNQYLLEDSIKKKAASIDSINAVERELDEVLKDLELNSQDLNEHFEDANEYNHIAKNIIELPITIQKNIKIENCTSSSSSSAVMSHNHNNKSPMLNKTANQKWSNNNNNFTDVSVHHNRGGPATARLNNIHMTHQSSSEYLAKPVNITNTTSNYCELYIDDVNEGENNGRAKPQQPASQIPNKRQNIISTYELCHECFDTNSLILSNGQNNKHTTGPTTTTSNSMRNTATSPLNHHHQHHSHHQNNKCCKTTSGNKSLHDLSSTPTKTCQSPTNGVSYFQNSDLKSNSPYTSSTCSSPVKLSASNSNHDLSSTPQHNNKPTNGHQYHNGGYHQREQQQPNGHHYHQESVLIPDVSGKSMNGQHHHNSESSSSNGHVISQKVISIGAGVSSHRTVDDSASSSISDSKSFVDRSKSKQKRQMLETHFFLKTQTQTKSIDDIINFNKNKCKKNLITTLASS